jgi:hypothetical protein
MLVCRYLLGVWIRSLSYLLDQRRVSRAWVWIRSLSYLLDHRRVSGLLDRRNPCRRRGRSAL